MKKNGLHINEVMGNDYGNSKVLKIRWIKKKYPSREIIYIGDTGGDIIESRKAGVKNIGVSWGFNSYKVLKKHRPDYLIRKPEELLKILG